MAEYIFGAIEAAVRVDTAGAVIAGDINYNIASTSRSGAGLYLVTLGQGIDTKNCYFGCVCETDSRVANVAQTSDTTFTVHTFSTSTGSATDSAFQLGVFRKSVG